MIKVIYRKFRKIVMGRKFGAFGSGSKIVHPVIRVSNYKNIFIGDNVLIKKNARIQPVLRWGNTNYSPQMIFEDGVVVEQNFHITCAKKVVIGKNSSINCNVLITDIDHDYSDVSKPILQQDLIVTETVIGEDCLIGAGAKIMAGSKIGKHSIIGANAVVTSNIPEYCVAVGIPARVIKKYNFEKKEWERV